MKASNATSATATAQAPRTGQSSAPLTRTSAEGFALSGPSRLPDPRFHAYRQDLADCALAGDVIASHYAEAVERVVKAPIVLRALPSDDGEAVAELESGSPFEMLDDSLGWAWGYGGKERRVGYLRSEFLSA